MNTRLLLLATAGAAGLALIVIGLAWSLHQPPAPSQPIHRHRAVHSVAPAAPSRAPTSPTHLGAADATRLLPFALAQIGDAADLACRFTAAYDTYRYDETPTHYLQRLTSMMSSALSPAIILAANDPGTLAQRRRAEESSVGRAQPDVIRALGPSSITFLITATADITAAHTGRRDTSRYAVTLTRTGDGWLVYAIELAAVGDDGGSGGTS